VFEVWTGEGAAAGSLELYRKRHYIEVSSVLLVFNMGGDNILAMKYYKADLPVMIYKSWVV
jgi:hypothetical protein